MEIETTAWLSKDERRVLEMKKLQDDAVILRDQKASEPIYFDKNGKRIYTK